MRISLSMLILWGVLFLSAGALFHSLFDWNVYSASPKLLFLYSGVPAILCLVISFILRQTEAVRSTIASLLLSIALAVYGIEAVLIFLLPRFTLIPAILSGSPCDLNSRLGVVLSLREQGRDAHPDIYPAFLRTLGLKEGGNDFLALGKIPLTTP